MPKKITKAVITAAGLGTRMLPISKSVPKEMLPIVDKPAIQYQVEEASRAGITDILIITARDKYSIENHFDNSPEYENLLRKKEMMKTLSDLCAIPNLADIHYIRQKEQRGLGHAVLCAKSFVGDDDFVVIYGDDVIISQTPVTSQLIETYNKYGGICVAGVQQVERSQLKKYCSLKVTPIESEDEFFVYDMIEKPQTESQMFSDYAILGRVLLTPEIFGILESQPTGANGEIQLTDSMQTLTRRARIGEPAKMAAKVFEGERHDMGSKFGFLRANIMEGLKHEETGDELREFLKNLKI